MATKLVRSLIDGIAWLAVVVVALVIAVAVALVIAYLGQLVVPAHGAEVSMVTATGDAVAWHYMLDRQAADALYRHRLVHLTDVVVVDSYGTTAVLHGTSYETPIYVKLKDDRTLTRGSSIELTCRGAGLVFNGDPYFKECEF